jgi:hypothetical protein
MFYRSGRPAARFGLWMLTSLALSGCAMPLKFPALPAGEFISTDKHSRAFHASDIQACEAARRALLSQGYFAAAIYANQIAGRKSFQPAPELHVELEVRVVCAPEGREAVPSLVFLSALEERFTLKKSNNAASLGVGSVGSLSLPLTSSTDALVKVGSETVSDAQFYDRFYLLLEKYLPDRADVERTGPAP